MKRRVSALLVVFALTGSACGSSEAANTAGSAESTVEGGNETAAQGVRLVSAAEGAEIQANPPQDLVILDVRTEEEFAQGHLEGATLIDFYRPDFADEILKLDPNVPYLIYCRSGNRSGQTAIIMDDLGFSDVADIDGGILTWTSAGLPTTQQ